MYDDYLVSLFIRYMCWQTIKILLKWNTTLILSFDRSLYNIHSPCAFSVLNVLSSILFLKDYKVIMHQ